MKLKDMRWIVTDTETTGLDPDNDRLVEIGLNVVWLDKKDSAWSTLINPDMHIPPEASAIHHLVDKDVRMAGKLCAHVKGIKVIARHGTMIAHNAHFDKSFLPFLDYLKWICTMRMAKKLWPESTTHSNQGLRYYLDLDVKPTGSIHRVDADVEVTTALFKRIIEEYTTQFVKTEKDDDFDKFYEWASSPILGLTMPFGKHKNVEFRKIPLSYLVWADKNLLDIDSDLKYTITHHLNIRKGIK